MRLGVVILAAGMGKRMRSALPKVLHPLAGRPLLAHVLDAAARIGSGQTVVVYGHGGEQVLTALADRDCAWVEQPERLGTAHAVQQAMPLVQAMDRILVLYGDVPLMDPETLGRLIEASRDCPLGILTAELEDPTGYGRIVRDPASGRILRIVEHKDATSEELGIREVNTGFLVADRARLQGWLDRLSNDNAQGEYYLTDIVALAVADGAEVATAQAPTVEEVSGVNDRIQLAALERYYQRRQAEDLMRAGVTLVDPARFDLRGTLETGQDVTIDVNLVFEGRVHPGRRVRIGPNCWIRDTVIGDGRRDPCQLRDRGVGDRPWCPRRSLRPPAPRGPPGRQDPHRQLRRDQEVPGRSRQQGQPPDLRGGHGDRQRGQRRRRHHHLQLRRGQQAPDGHRRRCLHRLQHRPGSPGDRGGRGDHRGRVRHHQGRPAGAAHPDPRPPGQHRRLAAAAERSPRPDFDPISRTKGESPCAVSSAPSPNVRSRPSCWKGSGDWSTGATTPPGWRSWRGPKAPPVAHPGQGRQLRDEVAAHPLPGTLGIAHTRWATHGEPATRNAHPHVCRDRCAVVHNGIIENHEAAAP